MCPVKNQIAFHVIFFYPKDLRDCNCQLVKKYFWPRNISLHYFCFSHYPDDKVVSTASTLPACHNGQTGAPYRETPDISISPVSRGKRCRASSLLGYSSGLRPTPTSTCLPRPYSNCLAGQPKQLYTAM